MVFRIPEKATPGRGCASATLERRSQNVPACTGLPRPLDAAQSVQGPFRYTYSQPECDCAAAWAAATRRRRCLHFDRSVRPLAAGAAAAVAGGWSSYEAPDIDYTEAITDLGNPAAFYPVARRLERTIIAHLVRRADARSCAAVATVGRPAFNAGVLLAAHRSSKPRLQTPSSCAHPEQGPTNSGKTHEALQHLRRSESGVYCGPLRLLAWQVRLLRGPGCDLAKRRQAG